MTSIAEGASARVVYKAYSTGVITSNAQPVSATDPAVTGGQILRRVSSSLQLVRAPYGPNEIRYDKQNADVRLGPKRVTGSILGDYSPLTYGDFIQAAMRGTWAAAITASEADFTSVAMDSTTSTATMASGAPVTKGFRVGDILRFTNLATAGNNSTNFLITGFSGTSNRIIAIYPAPTTMAADSAFNVVAFKSVFVPSSSFVDRKFGVEHYYEDIDATKLYTECRVGGLKLGLPATGMCSIEFPMMGRDMEPTSGASAPFFTSPTAETTTGLMTSVNGLLRVGGTNMGVITGLTLNMDLNPSAEDVVGQNFVPEINLGRANVTGTMNALLDDFTLINDFKNETEIDVLLYLTVSNAVGAAAVAIHLPRIKFTGDDNPLQGEGGQTITLPFQALKYVGTTASTGIEGTTIRVTDTEQT